MPLEVIGWIYLWIGGVSICVSIAYRYAGSDPDAEPAKPKSNTPGHEFGALALGLEVLFTLLFLLIFFLPYSLFPLYAWPLVFIVPWWLRKRRQKAASSSNGAMKPSEASPQKPGASSSY